MRTLAALITAAHLVISCFSQMRNSSGEFPTASAPSGASRSFSSGDSIARVASRLRTFTMPGGVPDGAKKPCHADVSKSLIPASIMVGSSGVAGERFAPVTAIARIRPART